LGYCWGRSSVGEARSTWGRTSIWTRDPYLQPAREDMELRTRFRISRGRGRGGARERKEDLAGGRERAGAEEARAAGEIWRWHLA